MYPNNTEMNRVHTVLNAKQKSHITSLLVSAAPCEGGADHASGLSLLQTLAQISGRAGKQRAAESCIHSPRHWAKGQRMEKHPFNIPVVQLDLSFPAPLMPS